MNVRVVYTVLSFVSLFGYLQITQADYFAYIEQLQLFLFSRMYAVETLCSVGGLSAYVARFVGQFFAYPGVGACVTAGLLTAILLLTQQFLKRVSGRFCYFLPALPVVGLLFVQLDKSYLPEGTWSYLLMLCALCSYGLSQNRWVRLGTGLLCQSALFLLCGSVATLFALLVFLAEMGADYKRGFYFLLLPLAAYGWGLFALHMEWLGTARFVWGPDLYYDPLIQQKALLYAWYALPLAWLMALCVSRWKEPGWAEWIKALIGWGAASALAVVPLRQIGDRIDYTFDRYLREGDWKLLIQAYRPGDTNLQRMNLLNLALAKEGRLSDEFLAYPQNQEGTLLAQWDHTVENAIVLADIYYHIGDIASAQKFAFEGFLSSQSGGNPRLLQLLVKTNLIFGAYRVAEKYCDLLRQTWRYRSWAEVWRTYANDQAVAAHAELSVKRKGLMQEGVYAVSGQLPRVLEQLMIHDPTNRMAVQYLTTYYLLNINLSAFRSLKETYYGTPGWRTLSVPQQEAMVALLQHQPGEWVKNGVSLKVEHHFNEFDRDMNRYHNQMNLKELMAEHYGSTYWYYLMFNRKKK
ncbi:MAG: DUF6057 family protein [Parabacteroides sp.]